MSGAWWYGNLAEVRRLAPEHDDEVPRTGVWWVEAWVPWGTRGDVGVAIARRFAEAIGASIVVEDGS